MGAHASTDKPARPEMHSPRRRDYRVRNDAAASIKAVRIKRRIGFTEQRAVDTLFLPGKTLCRGRARTSLGLSLALRARH